MEISQKIKPLTPGYLKIIGLITKIFNMKCFHELNNQGICIKYLQRKIDLVNITKTETINIQEIEIFEEQPELKVN